MTVRDTDKAVYSVIEDNAGDLHLFVFTDEGRKTCIGARTTYSYNAKQGSLTFDVLELHAGVRIEEFDPRFQHFFGGLDRHDYSKNRRQLGTR